jgi:hypothetical protein
MEKTVAHVLGNNTVISGKNFMEAMVLLVKLKKIGVFSIDVLNMAYEFLKIKSDFKKMTDQQWLDYFAEHLAPLLVEKGYYDTIAKALELWIKSKPEPGTEFQLFIAFLCQYNDDNLLFMVKDKYLIRETERLFGTGLRRWKVFEEKNGRYGTPWSLPQDLAAFLQVDMGALSLKFGVDPVQMLYRLFRSGWRLQDHYVKQLRSTAPQAVQSQQLCDQCQVEPVRVQCGNECGRAYYCGQACAQAHYESHVDQCARKGSE